MRIDLHHHAAERRRALGRAACLAAGLSLLAAGCGERPSASGEARARQVEPQAVLARIGAAEALATAALRAAETPAQQVAGYYARRAERAASGEAAEAAASAAPAPSGVFAPQSLPIPPGGVAATRLFAPASDPPQEAAAPAGLSSSFSPFEAAPFEAAPVEMGGFIRSDPPPFAMSPSGSPSGGAANGAPAIRPAGVSATGPSGRDPFQDFLEALHKARSGEDLRVAAEALAMEATAPAALTLAGSFETESPDVAVAVYDALWRVRNLPEAARHMGLAARDGRGVAQDRAAAAAYFREAAAFGDLQSRRLLEDLETTEALRGP